MNHTQIPFFVRGLNTLDWFMTWWITNIRLYLRLCYRVYTDRNPKLFRRLAQCKHINISSTLFFLFHVVMMALLPITKDIPDTTNPGIDYKQQLLAINVRSASVVSEIFEYIIGTVLFALLVTKLLRPLGKNSFWVTWRIFCYASAWFWPIILAATLYNNLGYSILQQGPLLLLNDIVQDNLDQYIIGGILVTLTFWGVTKYKWIKFILNHLDFNNQPKKQYVIKFIGCFLLMGYGLPFFITLLQSEKVIFTSLYEQKYESAIKQRDDVKICFYGDRLINLKNLPKRAIYHIFLTNAVVRMQRLNTPELKRCYSLAMKGKYPELEAALFHYLKTDPRASRFISAESLEKIQASVSDNQSSAMDNTLMLDQSFLVLKQLRLTPCDESFFIEQIPSILLVLLYSDDLLDN